LVSPKARFSVPDFRAGLFFFEVCLPVKKMSCLIRWFASFLEVSEQDTFGVHIANRK